MRVFLDANVLFSAANALSNIGHMVALLTKSHQALTSDFAWEEAERNILLKRPAWHPELIKLRLALEIVPSCVFELPILLEEKDRPILCTAIQNGCDLLATGDRNHFGSYYDQTIAGVTIVSLVGLAERLIRE